MNVKLVLSDLNVGRIVYTPCTNLHVNVVKPVTYSKSWCPFSTSVVYAMHFLSFTGEYLDDSYFAKFSRLLSSLSCVGCSALKVLQFSIFNP